MGVGQLSESDAVDALRLPFYSSSHPTGSHGWRNQFDLGNTSQDTCCRVTLGQEKASDRVAAHLIMSKIGPNHERILS